MTTWLSLFLLALIQAHASSIGVRTLTFEDAARQRSVTVEIWYPTEAQNISAAASDPLWIHPHEARGAPLAGSAHSLLVLSHGHRGERRDRSWLAGELAPLGYIIASIEHPGSAQASYDAHATLCFWNRPLDVSFVLDRLLEDPLWQEAIDPQRIGFIGYSLGGMTGLALAGARADMARQAALFLQKKYTEFTDEVIGQVDFVQGERDFKDERVRALALLSPATFVYSAEALRSLKAPLALIATLQDDILPYREHAYKLRDL